ncbi:MAG: FliH/SctL family protein [Gammaproteobacteria bacterium]
MSDIDTSPSAFDRWQPPSVEADNSNFNSQRGERGLSLRDLERIQKQAYDEAFAQGKADGLAAGVKQAQAQARTLFAMLDRLTTPFAQLDDCIVQQTAELVMVVARRLFRRELKTDPSCVIGVVREALDALPVAARDVRVLLHPQDADLVSSALKETEGERAWHVVEDPLLSRGGCRVETATSRIDARVETRLEAIANALLGDERAES